MQHIDSSGPNDLANPPSGRWYRELTRYHWLVLIIAALGWLFDTMDQQLFTLARAPAMVDLLAPSEGVKPDKGTAQFYGGVVTSIFLIGWATGGLAFGILGDRIGRKKTMMLTILLYSLFTGLSALSVGIWDFAFYRFLTGLGVGGEFAVGVSLVAEAMPERARPFALGLLQALSAIGNITAGLIGISFSYLESAGVLGDYWRWMFVVGVLPAFVVVLIYRRLEEPERWQSAAASGSKQQLGSYSELFGDPRWRRNAIVGLVLASAGIVGLWGIGFFSPDLIRLALAESYKGQGLTEMQIDASLSFWASVTLILQNIGAFFGIYAFSHITHYTGRKPAFAVSFVLATISTGIFFGACNDLGDIFWMAPLMGFCQLALFGGYAIYFPELFPTRLRSTGISFCYNVGRYLAAVGPYTLGYLAKEIFYDKPEPMRYAGVAMCSVFLLGLLALPFAPETKGKPLPE